MSTYMLRKQFSDWISNAAAEFNYAVTLTYPLAFEVSSKDCAEKMAKRFCDRYNREFGYGSNHRRKRVLDPTKAAPMIMINDGNGNYIRFHHHLALSKPADITDADYKNRVDACWQKCLRGQSGITDVQPIATNGWNVYLAQKLEVGNQEAFDVFNSNIY